MIRFSDLLSITVTLLIIEVVLGSLIRQATANTVRVFPLAWFTGCVHVLSLLPPSRLEKSRSYCGFLAQVRSLPTSLEDGPYNREQKTSRLDIARARTKLKTCRY